LEFQQHTTVVESLDSPALQKIDWPQIRSAAFMIHQRFHYRYPGQIQQLRQRLMVVPPERHGDQRLVTHKLEISSPTTDVRREVDQFGNLSLNIAVDYVARVIEFTVWLVVERIADGSPIVVPATVANDPCFSQPSGLTEPGPMLLAAAAELRASGATGQELATRINTWVHQLMTYEHGTTDIWTTAEEAIVRRTGVCQDYSHVMIALCRLCDLPARYVSGHLLGEGATHAWVEVIVPDVDRPGRWQALPFDPTNGTVPALHYISVATGRDYSDVAPTSGTFVAPFGGELIAGKRAGMVFLNHERTLPE